MEPIHLKITKIGWTRIFFLIIVLYLFSITTLKAQDRVIKISGDTIKCKITYVDSMKLVYEIEKEYGVVTNTLGRAEVKSFAYLYKYTTSTKYKVDTLKSLGLTIVYKRNGKPVKFIKDGRFVTMSHFGELVKSNTAAYELYKKAKHRNKLTRIFIKSGAACIGYSLGYAIGTAAAGGTADAGTILGLSATGSVFIVVGVLFSPKTNYLLAESAKKYELESSK